MLTGAIALSRFGMLLLLAGAGPFHGRQPRAGTILSAEEVLEKTRALYPTLTSYADSGTVTSEVTGFSNRARFRTYFVNTPRNYFFDYVSTVSEYTNGTRIPLKDRIVLWMFKGQLQSWNSALGTIDEYPEGSNQVAPFITAGSGTYGAAILIPSLIYAKARLFTTIQELGDVTSAGFEQIRGRRCYKLLGVARSVYPSGKVTNVRNATVWIDAETFLIRQVFTDTPKGYPMGQISRLTVTYEPRLNPVLPDSLFSFTPPSGQQ